MPDTTTKKKRTVKTRKQRAAERLETTDRLLKRADKKLAAAKAEVGFLEDEIADLKARREYEAKDPALEDSVDDDPDGPEPDDDTPLPQ